MLSFSYQLLKVCLLVETPFSDVIIEDRYLTHLLVCTDGAGKNHYLFLPFTPCHLRSVTSRNGVSTRMQIEAVDMKTTVYPIESPIKANIIQVNLKRRVLFIKAC